MFFAGRSIAFVAQKSWTKVGVAVPSGALRTLQSTSSKAATDTGKKIRKAAETKVGLQRMKKDEHQPPLINLYTINKEDLQDIVVAWGYPKYRADQIYHWVREKGVVDVEDMKNLPKKLKEDLAKFSSSGSQNTDMKPEISRLENEGSKMKYTGGSLEIVKEQTSKDGTIKRLYRLRDGLLIESVLMVYADGRRTACISSQAGCAQGCVFCATGKFYSLDQALVKFLNAPLM
jgi:adenine C2-methylase RlmN of 23S rRNA A2503 and tRNA A37